MEDDVEDEESAGPQFILISSSGPTAFLSQRFGVYRQSEEMRDGRSVYIQDHDTQYGVNHCKLYSDHGVWVVTFDGEVRHRAATPSQSPTTVKWQYKHDKWREDPALTVRGLSERPRRECEVRITLSEDITRSMKKVGVAGVYRADSTYSSGRPVFRHSGGVFTLRVCAWGGGWEVRSGVGGAGHLSIMTAPSMCPAEADPSRRGDTHWRWRYLNKQGEDIESGDVIVTCIKHKH